MRVIVTGSTGMVGNGVLIECLEDSRVEKVLAINRSSLGIQHPKLEELIVKEFIDIKNYTDNLKGYDACFHSMGVSSLGLNEMDYTRVTYDITKALADTLYDLNSKMIFSYVSGQGTDSSEKGRLMWARVKGKTENYILNKGFKDAYAFRPGAIIPEKGVKSRTAWVNIFLVVFKPLFPIMKMSKNITTSSRIGQVMINIALEPSTLKHLEGKDINQLATKAC